VVYIKTHTILIRDVPDFGSGMSVVQPVLANPA